MIRISNWMNIPTQIYIANFVMDLTKCPTRLTFALQMKVRALLKSLEYLTRENSFRVEIIAQTKICDFKHRM